MRYEYIEYFKDMEAIIRNRRRKSWLIKAIDDATKEHKLRSDGFVFLHLNIEMMIALPLGMRYYDYPYGYDEEDRVFRDPIFRELVKEDLRLIIESSSHLQKDDPQYKKRSVKGITANAIVRTLAKLGDKIQMQADDFWGP